MDLVAQKIKRYREMMNYSQEYVAIMIGISQPAYAKIEQGKTKITIERLKKISEVLKVEHLHLLDGVKISIQKIPVAEKEPISDIESLRSEIKEMYDKLIKILENQNHSLKQENERLRKQLNQKR